MSSLSYHYFVNVPRSEQSILVTVRTEIKKIFMFLKGDISVAYTGCVL